jgi:hypothetical protein
MKTNLRELELVPVNLQLFAGDDKDEGSDVDYQDAAELDDEYFDEDEDDKAPDEIDDPEDSDDDLDESDDSEEEKEPEDDEKPKGKPNKVYQQMRQKAEADAEKKIAAERAALDAERAEIARQRQENEQAAMEKQIRDEMLTPQKIWERADAEGLTEEQAEKMLRWEADKKIADEKAKILAKFETIQRQKETLKTDRLYSVLAPEVEKVISQRPDLDFQTVYYHMKGMRGEELSKKVETDAVKRTLANVHDRARRKSVGGSAGGADEHVTPTAVLSREGMEMSAAFGIDPRKIAKRVKEHQKNTRRR